jgi:tetratricopeptide (TPR) repeat protein
MSVPIFSENLAYLEPLMTHPTFQNHWSFLNSLAKGYWIDRYETNKALKYFKTAEKLAKYITGHQKIFYWKEYAKCYEKKENYQKACQYYALEMTHKQTDVYFFESYAWSLLKDFQFSSSLDILDKVFELDPHNKWALGASGYCHEEMKNFAPALEYFEKALKLNASGKVWTMAHISRCHRGLDNPEKAFEYAFKCEELDKNYVWNLHNLGWWYFNDGDFDAAKKYFSRVIDNEKTTKLAEYAPYAYMNLGHIQLIEMQSAQEAMVLYQKGMNLYKKKKKRQQYAHDFINDKALVIGFGIPEDKFVDLWETLKGYC